MITTRARAGSPGTPGRPDAAETSVIGLDLLEQAEEIARGEPGGRTLEPFHPPAPEVEVDRARAVLDRAPQGPPVHADQPEQPGPGDPAAPRPAVVGGDQVGQGVPREVGFGPDVAELEARVVVAGQLVVDQPDPVPVVDEVRG